MIGDTLMNSKRMRALLLCLFLLFSGCSVYQEPLVRYPKKPDGGSERQAGAAMFFFEQAEKDLDVTENVTVFPPENADEMVEEK